MTLNALKALKASQELDECIFAYYDCKTDEGRKLVKALIDAKRSELYNNIGEL